MQVTAKKSLGQNFLKDEAVLDAIIDVSEVLPGDNVLEIGPGTGLLTEKLAKAGAKVLAIELDHELVLRLNAHFIESDSVSILEGNILDIHLEELLLRSGYEENQYKVVANIPYYITAPIIRSLLSLAHQPTSLTLMVQNEVADRLTASPGHMSLLSIMAQYYAQVEKKFFVPKTAFDPIPAVDSAVIQLIPQHAFNTEEDMRVFRIVRAGFSARRKTLANNLASSFHMNRSAVEQFLASLGLTSMIRAQELSVAQWRALADVLKIQSTQKQSRE